MCKRILFVVVFAVLLAVLSVSFAAAQPTVAPQNAVPTQAVPATELTIPAIFAEGGLTGRAPETLKWSPDGKRLSYVLRDDAGEHGALYALDLATGKAEVLVSQEKLTNLAPSATAIKDERERERVTRYSVAGYQWAPDSKHLLFESHGQLWYYSLETGTGVQVTSNTDPSGDPKFSPDGKRISYLRKHELWVRRVDGEGDETKLTEGKEGRPGHVNLNISLKDDAKKDAPGPDDILNGEVDWVYAEELSARSHYFWSPDGRHIAYLQMDETKVPTYPIEDFIPTAATVDNQKYPKPGDPNPAVRVGVVSTGGGRTRWIAVPGANFDEQDIYIPRFGWVRNGLLWIEVLNRAQSKLDLYFADTESGRTRLVLSDSSMAWVNVHDDFRMLASGDRFLWSSWRDGHTHLYLYSFNKANPLQTEVILERQLTRGDGEVFGLSAVDEKSGTVYYESNQGDPRQHQVWSVKLAGGEAQKISREAGTHTASFPDQGAEYWIDTRSALLTPPRMALCRADGTCRPPFWESRSLEPLGLAELKALEMKAADGKTTLYGQLLMPPRNARPAAAGRIPLIVFVYGGPAGQVVQDAWGGTTFLFHQLLARRGFAVFSVDNRGTPNRGRDFLAAAGRKQCVLELEDQLAALTQLLQQEPQLDRERVGIWGWSNGGTMTLYAMTHSDRFRAGISVAPVADQRDYDSIYMERYLGLPKDNAEGYRVSAPLNFAADLKGRVLIVHGTGDDNVHMQNTIQMVNNLINANKQFDLMLYPRKTHSIAGPAARTNLFEKMVEHWERWLAGSSQPSALSPQP